MRNVQMIIFILTAAAFLSPGCRETVPSKTGILSEQTSQGAYTVTVRCLPKEGTAGLQAENTAIEAARLTAQTRAKELFPGVDSVKLGEDTASSFDGTAATVTYRVKDPSIKKK